MSCFARRRRSRPAPRIPVSLRERLRLPATRILALLCLSAEGVVIEAQVGIAAAVAAPAKVGCIAVGVVASVVLVEIAVAASTF